MIIFCTLDFRAPYIALPPFLRLAGKVIGEIEGNEFVSLPMYTKLYTPLIIIFFTEYTMTSNKRST
jgi:hypothetical protein